MAALQWRDLFVSSSGAARPLPGAAVHLRRARGAGAPARGRPEARTARQQQQQHPPFRKGERYYLGDPLNMTAIFAPFCNTTRYYAKLR